MRSEQSDKSEQKIVSENIKNKIEKCFLEEKRKA